MRDTANSVGSTRALACRFRRPRRNFLGATPDSASEGADRCTRGACAPPAGVLDHATSEITNAEVRRTLTVFGSKPQQEMRADDSMPLPRADR